MIPAIPIVHVSWCVDRSACSGAVQRWRGSDRLAGWTTQRDVYWPRSAAAQCSVAVPWRSTGHRQLGVHCRHFTIQRHRHQPSTGLQLGWQLLRQNQHTGLGTLYSTEQSLLLYALLNNNMFNKILCRFSRGRHLGSTPAEFAKALM